MTAIPALPVAVVKQFPRLFSRLSEITACWEVSCPCRAENLPVGSPFALKCSCSPPKDFNFPPCMEEKIFEKLISASFCPALPTLATFPAGFPFDFLGKPAEKIANGNHMIIGCFAIDCKCKPVDKCPKCGHMTEWGKGF